MSTPAGMMAPPAGEQAGHRVPPAGPLVSIGSVARVCADADRPRAFEIDRPRSGMAPRRKGDTKRGRNAQPQVYISHVITPRSIQW